MGREYPAAGLVSWQPQAKQVCARHSGLYDNPMYGQTCENHEQQKREHPEHPRRTATFSGRSRCTGSMGRSGESKWGEISPAQDKKKDNCRPQGKLTESWNWKPLSSWNSHGALSFILSKAVFKSIKLTLSILLEWLRSEGKRSGEKAKGLECMNNNRGKEKAF